MDASKIAIGGSKTKCISKASKKPQSSTRKAHLDISNSVKLSNDQNLNVDHDASAEGKTNVSETLKKGGLGGRKPLGDSSKSVQPKKEVGASKIMIYGSKKKSISKASKKSQTSTRKGLSDISNSGKPRPNEASKKNLNVKLSVLEEEDLSGVAEEDFDVADEYFQHNHEECFKTMPEQIVKISNFPKRSVSSWVAFLTASLPSYAEHGFDSSILDESTELDYPPIEPNFKDISSILNDLETASPPSYMDVEELGLAEHHGDAKHGFGDAEDGIGDVEDGFNFQKWKEFTTFFDRDSPELNFEDLYSLLSDEESGF